MTSAAVLGIRVGYEVPAMLTATGGTYLADDLWQADTPAFRSAAANHAGTCWSRRFARERQQFGSAITVASALLEDRPDTVEHLKKRWL